jgi:hypothetical protein
MQQIGTLSTYMRRLRSYRPLSDYVGPVFFKAEADSNHASVNEGGRYWIFFSPVLMPTSGGLGRR